MAAIHQSESESQPIDLRAFLGVVRRRRISIVLVTLLVLAVGLLLVYRRTSVYSSVARVEVRPLIAGGDLQGFYYDLLSNMDTEAQRVTSRDVATIAGRQLDVITEDEQLGIDEIATLTADVSTSVPPNTSYIDITCTTLDPADSQACADAFALAYVADRESLARRSADAARQGVEEEIAAAEARIRKIEEQRNPAGDPAVQADLVDQIDTEERAIDTARLQLLAVPTASPNPALLALPSSLPTVPSNKSYITTGVLATVVGFVLGISIAFMRERLDERVGWREGLEAAIGAPVLAVVPRVPSWRNRNDARLVTVDAPDTVTAEAYRTARTTLQYLASRGDIKVIMVTGPGEGEGKTTTTANLATALAQAGRHVVVVSADLRKPRLSRFFGLDEHAGLAEVLQGTVALRAAIASTRLPNLKVLPSGAIPPNPAELLASQSMDDLIETLRSVSDFVLIDTPPSLVVADALELAPKSDGIVVVCDGSKTTRQAATHLRQQLERVGGLIVGGILNNLDPGQEAPYGRYYGSRDASYRKPTLKARKEHARTKTISIANEADSTSWDPTAEGGEPADVPTSGVAGSSTAADEVSPNGGGGSVKPQADVADWR